MIGPTGTVRVMVATRPVVKMQNLVICEVHSGVGVVTLNRPERHNAFGSVVELYSEDDLRG